jgi:hypothetical protein
MVALAALRVRLEKVFDGAQLNQCPNDPPCDQDDPLPMSDWCGVCLLITDIRNVLDGEDR